MAAVTTDFVTVGNLRIPAENMAEWDRINDQIHELVVAGKPVPRELWVRMYVQQGRSEAEAELLATEPANFEEHDCHNY